MIQLKKLKLIGLISVLASFNTYSVDVNKENQIRTMLAEFLDLKSKPAQGFETWIDELCILIKQEPEFASLFSLLNKIRDNRNARLVQFELLKYRNQAPTFVRTILSAKPVSELATILAERVKTRKA